MTNHFHVTARSEAHEGAVDAASWSRALRDSGEQRSVATERYVRIRARQLRGTAIAAAFHQRFQRVAAQL